MGALHGSPAARALAVLKAGCDIALHCNGTMAEMREIAAVCAALCKTACESFEQNGYSMAMYESTRR